MTVSPTARPCDPTFTATRLLRFLGPHSNLESVPIGDLGCEPNNSNPIIQSSTDRFSCPLEGSTRGKFTVPVRILTTEQSSSRKCCNDFAPAGCPRWELTIGRAVKCDVTVPPPAFP